jgi:hypothetical protein
VLAIGIKRRRRYLCERKRCTPRKSGRKGIHGQWKVGLLAKQIGSRHVFNTYAQSPLTCHRGGGSNVVVGAGLTAEDFYGMQQNASNWSQGFKSKTMKQSPYRKIYKRSPFTLSQ